jgi:hypothetical protein
MFLYTGMFFDYGLNDPTKKNRKSPSDYTDPTINDMQLLQFSDRIHLFTFGIKLRLAFAKGAGSPMACPAFK